MIYLTNTRSAMFYIQRHMINFGRRETGLWVRYKSTGSHMGAQLPDSVRELNFGAGVLAVWRKE